MAKHSLPAVLVERDGHLLHAFEGVASAMGDTQAEAERLFKLLPISLRNAPAFVLRVDGRWKYQYGVPYDNLSGNTVALGADQCPDAALLYTAVKAVESRLTNSEIVGFLDRLGIPGKHRETLAELTPLVRCRVSARVEHEPADSGADGRTPDWLFTPGTPGRPLLIEVKHRCLDLITMFKENVPRLNAGARSMEPPEPQVDRLFLDTWQKFQRRDPRDVLQGAWVFCPIQQVRAQVETYFESVDPQLLHFALLVNWEFQVAGLWRSKEDREYVLSLFEIEEAGTFFRDAAT
ncbi:MAG TPA: hypothetical protein PK435_12225 [Thermoanaerobaculaceae bacterium]|nr:hypothetical protein [Thermoanaerobaculaceae bacterium]